MKSAKRQVLGTQTVWVSLKVQLLFWFMYVQPREVQKGWVNLNVDQRLWLLINILSASHITGLITETAVPITVKHDNSSSALIK